MASRVVTGHVMHRSIGQTPLTGLVSRIALQCRIGPATSRPIGGVPPKQRLLSAMMTVREKALVRGGSEMCGLVTRLVLRQVMILDTGDGHFGDGVLPITCGAPRLYPSSVADYCGGRAAVASCVGG
jgi:hypothetical protein